jgi:hypothetical protein
VLNATVPVGVLDVPEPMSVTVAVHVDGWPTVTTLGEQLTSVKGERKLTLTG